MKIKDCFQLGYFEKVIGVSGELVLVIDSDNPAYYKNLKNLFILHDDALIPYMVEAIKIKGSKGVVRLEAVQSVQEAVKLKGKEVYLPDSELPKLKKGQYYFHDLIGLQVVDESYGSLGLVEAYYNMPQNNLLAMKYQGREILIPANEAVIKHVDVAAGVIKTSLPAGLIEIYLDEESPENEI